jgi:hypothetical protein
MNRSDLLETRTHRKGIHRCLPANQPEKKNKSGMRLKKFADRLCRNENSPQKNYSLRLSLELQHKKYL